MRLTPARFSGLPVIFRLVLRSLCAVFGWLRRWAAPPEQITEYTRDAEHLNEVEHRRAMLVARVGFYQRVIVGAVTMLALLVARRRWHRVVFLWAR